MSASFVIGASDTEIIADGACKTVSHPTTGVSHQYKCCDGQMYGSISTHSADTVDLCADDVGDKATQCTMFGANMFRTTGGGTDPSLGCTGNNHFSALTDDCAANVCTCTAHGTPVADADCTRHGNEQCDTCFSGFHKTYTDAEGVEISGTVFDHTTASIPCVRNTCTCAHGTPFVDADPATATCGPVGDTNACSACDAGYTLNVATKQCEINTCSCKSGEVTIGVPATGLDCTTEGVAMDAATQKCMSCNTGFTFADNDCTVVDPCTHGERTADEGPWDVCNQANTANTCAVATPTALTKNRPFECTCSGNYNVEFDCKKCMPGFTGADCTIACTNMLSPSDTYTYNPAADTAFTNAATCSFTCAEGLSHTPGADVCS